MVNEGKQLIIVLGDYGSGKTTFAKHYAQTHHGFYLDFDMLYFAKTNQGDERFSNFLPKLQSLLDTSDNQIFVLDGYQTITDGYEKFADPPFTYLKKSTGCEIKLCLCFAAPHIIRKRQIAKEGLIPAPRDENQIKSITYSLFGVVTIEDSDPMLIDTTNGFNIVPTEVWFQRWRELIFLSDLDKMKHDKYYQTIELPSGLSVLGYSNTQESWKTINHVIDFKGKSVLDIGCFHGYNSFKAEGEGASRVLGIEINESALETCKRLAWLKKSAVQFQQGDIATLNLDGFFDIIFVLNVLHHVKDLESALTTLFKSGNQILFEIPEIQEEIVKKSANKFGFKAVLELASHREGRLIVLFENNQTTKPSAKEVPCSLLYSPSRYKKDRLKRTIKDAIIKTAIKLKLIKPLVWVVRKTRKPADRYVYK